MYHIFKLQQQGWGEYWTYEYEYWKISTRVVIEYNVFSIFIFIILYKTSTRVVLAPALYSKINQFGTFHMLSHTVYFAGMMVSPLHRRCTIEYQYSCQYSYEYLSTCPQVRVQVWVLWLSNSRVRVQYEYQKFSTRVLRVRVQSTSTPALVTVRKRSIRVKIDDFFSRVT